MPAREADPDDRIRRRALTIEDRSTEIVKTLNEVIDAQEKRLTAVRNRVPSIVLVALYGTAVAALAFAATAVD